MHALLQQIAIPTGRLARAGGRNSAGLKHPRGGCVSGPVRLPPPRRGQLPGDPPGSGVRRHAVDERSVRMFCPVRQKLPLSSQRLGLRKYWEFRLLGFVRMSLVPPPRHVRKSFFFC